MRKVWKKISELLEAGLRHQVTRSGLAFTVVILMVGLAAFASANNLLFLLLAAMLSTLLVSGFISRLGLSGLELEFQLPEHVSARRKTTGRLLVRNAKRWMTSFSVHLTGLSGSGVTAELYFPVIPGGARLEETVEAFFARRGPHRENSFQFSTRFPFGFTERRAQVTLAREILVYPSIDPQPGFDELMLSLEGELEAHYRGRGHDFYRIRPYEALESARHVDWRATAHTGDLQVREFAREQEHAVEIFLDLDIPPDRDAWFEKAVDCCAFLSWRLAQRGSRVRVASQNFDMCLPLEGDVYTILKYLALVTPVRGRSEAARSQDGVPVLPDDESSFQIVFSAAAERLSDSPWRDARLLGLDAFVSRETHGTDRDEKPGAKTLRRPERRK